MNIYDKKYQIFVSSTYLDLIKAREEVIKVILGLYQIPIGMEMFSADNEEQWSVIKSTIDSSDYYILIIGHRYGSVTKEEISYTEKEFDYAKANGVPIVAFVRDRNIPTSPDQRDSEQFKIEKLEKFVDKVLNNAMCDFWKNENELGQKVAISLTKIFFKSPRIGWIRSDRGASQETTEELTNLIQENRELRSELEKIKATFSKERPKIGVKINDKKKLQLEYKKEGDWEFKEVPFSSIPDELIKFTSKEEIEIYNNALKDKKDEINEYTVLNHQFDCKTKNNTLIIIQISNDGGTKANDVYVDLTFPKEVLIFEKMDLDELKNPKKPEIPENPINSALRKKQESKINKPKYYGGTITNVYGNAIISPNYSSRLIRNISNVNRNFWIDAYKNQLTIKLNKLSHTRTITIDDEILIAPLAQGKYEIDVEVICDEFKDTEKFKIPIEIK